MRTSLMLAAIASLAASATATGQTAYYARSGGVAPKVTTPTWSKCADENGQCSFSGTRQVRYGVDGRFTTLTRTNGVTCGNAVFGDPAYGIVKRCDVLI